MRYTSVSDMLFKSRMQDTGCKIQDRENPALRIMHHVSCIVYQVSFILLLTAYCLLPAAFSHAELIDRVVAFVDKVAITLTELEDKYKDTARLKPDIKKEEVLNTMINRILLLREAKELRIESQSEDDIIREYIELKIKTVIRITEHDVKEYYEKNRSEFGKSEFDDVRDMIENYFIEKKVNEGLKRHIEVLRSKAYIKIQIDK